MSSFFVSYSRVDKGFVGEMEDELAERGISLWIDTIGQRAGKDWKKAIDAAIETHDGMIVVISPASLASQYVTYEWSYAMGLRKPIIPVMIERPDAKNEFHQLVLKDGMPAVPALHPKLEALHYLDFTDPDTRDWDSLLGELSLATANFSSPVQAALEMFNSPMRTDAIAAAQALVEDIEDDTAALALLQTTKHTNRFTRGVAATAFAQKTNYADIRAVEPLVEVFHKNLAGKRDEAIEYLGNLGRNFSDVVNLLMILGKEAQEQNDWDTTQKIMRALAQTRNYMALDFLIPYAQSGVFQAIVSLRHFPDQKTEDILLGVLEDNPKQQVTGHEKQRLFDAAADGLLQIGTEQTATKLGPLINRLMANRDGYKADRVRNLRELLLNKINGAKK